MNILGNGVDIVENKRIKKIMQNKNFIRKIFTSNEIELSKKKFNKVNFYAKRFAAKEAFLKALGTGLRKGISFKDISVKNTKLGKPKLILNKRIRLIIKKKLKIDKLRIFLSISDENKYSIAFVVINKY